MEKIFKTLIKSDHELGGNEYVEGFIAGMQQCICNHDDLCKKREGYALIGAKRGFIMMTKTTDIQYGAFAKSVEFLYPGLCEFYYGE